MIGVILQEVGPWSWWILGMVLLGAEIVVPGVFLVWVGLAAIAVGALSLAVWGASFWQWEVQLVVFAALSVVFVLAGRRFYAQADKHSDEPLLNQRGATLVGRIGTLGEPVVDGRGRLKVDDSFWPVRGQDMPAGSRVRISGVDGSVLLVEKA